MSCRGVRDLLHRDVETLDAAAGLQLEDHLAGCARCRVDRAQLRRVRRLGESLAVLEPDAHDVRRAIARALLEGGARPAPPLPSRRWIPAAAFAAAAAVALLAFFAVRGRGAEAPPGPTAASSARQEASAPRVPAPSPGGEVERGDVVDEGNVYAGSTVASSGDAVPAETLLRSDGVSRLHLAAAHVLVAANAELRWLPVDRTILLERGVVAIDTPSADVIRVAAVGFVAELRDADATVTTTAVRVRRGQVTIIASSSQTVLARIEAGGEWTLPEPPRSPRDHGLARSPTIAELMTRARGQFAARQYDEATRTVEDALALSPRRGDEAEARIFLGDIAQATGDLALAARRYTAVAETFAGEPPAESALYAAARVELRRGHAAAARVLLARYLDRYPAGRYADDVRRELGALPHAPP